MESYDFIVFCDGYRIAIKAIGSAGLSEALRVAVCEAENAGQSNAFAAIYVPGNNDLNTLVRSNPVEALKQGGVNHVFVFDE